MIGAVVLSDRTILRLIDEGRIGIDPYDPGLMQPSSLDVRVDGLFRVFRNSRYPFIDVKLQQEELTELVEVPEGEAFILHPGEFVLGSTLERVTLPDDLVSRLEGKSSLGRLGLLIHSTAGFIDPGWDGHVTLELSNVANLPITIYPRNEDRPTFVHAARRAGGAAVRRRRSRLEVPGSARPDTEPVLEELRGVVQTVLVTGSTGFIGRHVVEELAGRGHWVRALVRDLKGAETLEGIDCELARGDVTSPESLAAAADGCDAIVHLVAIITGKPEAFEAVIAEGTRNVVAAAQASGVRKLVHMSALGVGPETKDSVPYYRAKWAAEQTVAASGVPHAIVRPSFVFGDGGALPTFVRVARLAPDHTGDRRRPPADPADLGR